MVRGWIIQDIGSGFIPITLKKWTRAHPGNINTTLGMMYWDTDNLTVHGGLWFLHRSLAHEVLFEIIEQERHLHKVYVLTEVLTFKIPVEDRLGSDEPMSKQES